MDFSSAIALRKCVHFSVWDEPLSVPYLQAKKQYCVCGVLQGLSFLNTLCLQLHYFFHIPTICVLKTWNHQCFVLNLVITDSLTIHSPPFFASLQSYTVPFSALFSFLFVLCISGLLTSFCFSWSKRQAEKKMGVVGRGSAYVWTSSTGWVRVWFRS